MRTVLLTYANAHPSDDVRELTGEVVEAIGTSLSATRYLFLSLNTAGMGDGWTTSTTQSNDSGSPSRWPSASYRRSAGTDMSPRTISTRTCSSHTLLDGPGARGRANSVRLAARPFAPIG
jgi:hypothetical protein